MTFPTSFDFENTEDQIYQKWEQNGYFKPKSESKKGTFSIMMPPPNATGELHLGHATMLAIEDIITRFKRMQGYSTLWLPGTDHASIATQNRVEKNLATKSITRHELGREKFLKEVESFVEGSKNTIRNQVRKMGASCDWNRERYTMDEGLNQAVSEVFIRMYNDGLIYKGSRVVNWCTRCSSTLADDEVDHKEVKAKLHYFKYGPLEIATSRPETKLADTAVAVNPSDERYKHLIGQTLEIDFVTHKISVIVIGDESVDPEFGTGALGVTPAHSLTDYELAKKHNIPMQQVINEKGLITEVGGKYQGLSVQEARKQFIQDLIDNDLYIKEEDYKQNLSVCYRCDTSIEPLISKQWFIDVNKANIEWNGGKKSIKEIAIEVVKEKAIEIIPAEFNKTYFNWIENLHDWCISRQIWFGHRIPVWYNGTEIKVQKESPGAEWSQDEDTLDTWFSSGLWTFSTLGWPNNTEDLKKFHPTSVLETGHDILFFWVARMIIMTTYALKEVPFKKVYLHGLVRDKNGKKMSKSLGNGIDPLDMIAKYGTDPVRLSLVIGSTPGRDIKLYEEKIAGYRNFITKIWNSSRFVLTNIQETQLPATFSKSTPTNIFDDWIIARLNETITEVTTLLEEYKFSEAGQKIYNFLWDEFCDWYLELSKKQKNETVLIHVLKNILIMLHPFTPFITESIWEKLNEPIMLIETEWPEATIVKESKAQKGEQIIKIIKEIRTIKSHFGLSTSNDLKVLILDKSKSNLVEENEEIIKKMARIGELVVTNTQPLNLKHTAMGAVSSDIIVYIFLEGKIDFQKETEKTENELLDKKKFLKSIQAKLDNKSFVENAPEEVLNTCRENFESTTQLIQELENRLNVLKI